jgi:hypothetical protein
VITKLINPGDFIVESYDNVHPVSVLLVLNVEFTLGGYVYIQHLFLCSLLSSSKFSYSTPRGPVQDTFVVSNLTCKTLTKQQKIFLYNIEVLK